MMQGFGPPAVIFRATLDQSSTLVCTKAKIYGVTLTVGHQWDFNTTPRTPIASALGSQRNSGSRLRSLAENSKSIWQCTSMTPSIMSSYRVMGILALVISKWSGVSSREQSQELGKLRNS